MIDFLTEIFTANEHQDAVVWNDQTFSYQWLLDRIAEWNQLFEQKDMAPGSVVMLQADFSPSSIAAFLALAERSCILVPLAGATPENTDELIDTAQGEVSVVIDPEDRFTVRSLRRSADHELYARLRGRKHPGVVLFSSGSTGKSKAAVHDLVGLLEKFKVARRRLRTLSFLLYDHIGGINTMLYTLSNAGCLVTAPDRTADEVLATVEKHQVELLPTSPTFINLILLSQAYERYDLSSLKIVTYGTEPMLDSTLKRFHEILPQVKLQQTYGLSEVGILRTKSRGSDSLWMKVGGEGFKTRVVEGILHIKARSAMLGYLNAPSPFTSDGWLVTGDSVEVDGDDLRVLGRKSEIINVGGQKVYPAEVESVIQDLDNVAEVTVYGERNPITGQFVCALLRLVAPEDPKELRKRLKAYCRRHLEPFKVPVKVRIEDQAQHSFRFKKTRPATG